MARPKKNMEIEIENDRRTKPSRRRMAPRIYGPEIGARYGRLVIVDAVRFIPGEKRKVVCSCDCGASVILKLNMIRTGASKSCGCLRSEKAAARMRLRKTHGESSHGILTAEYRIWGGMINRCTNPNDSHWHRYGGRGISVCNRWLNSYQDFLTDVGRRPTECHSLDRFPDNDGNYESDNVRWATKKEQARNTSTNRLIKHNGETLCVTEWADRVGISASVLSRRLKKQSAECALTTPLNQAKSRARRTHVQAA